MRVLVLGSSGFVGRHVAAELVGRRHDVVGWSRTRLGAPWSEHAIDLRDAAALAREDERFDAALLLAGRAVPGSSFDEQAAATNVAVAQNALDYLARTSRGARVIVMSSAHVYGALGDAEPLPETRACSPNGLYGESKLAVEQAARTHAAELEIVIVRSFNQIGRHMPHGLLLPDLIAALESGSGPVQMRGPDGARDFLDVRDGARALALLLTAPCASGSVFNLCSGRGVLLSHLAAELARALGVARDVRFPSRNPLPFVGSRAALTRVTGFEPEHTLTTTLGWIAGETARAQR